MHHLIVLRHLVTGAPSRAPALAARGGGDHDRGRRHPAAPSRWWVALRALAHAAALIDPTGLLLAQRLRDAREEARRDGR